jgi:ABC-2 type transport system permease protein
MPIFDQGYQHWQGKLSGHAWRWWAVTRHGVRVQFRSRWTKMLVTAALAPSLALAAVLIIWGLIEQKASIIQPLLSLLGGLPKEFQEEPRAYRLMIWTLAFHFFFMLELLFSMLLVLLVGPDLISKDLRFNALPLYLAKPLRRSDYFLGKLGVIGVYVALVTVAPVLVAYVLGVGFSLDWQIFKETGPLLLASIGYSLVVIVSTGTLMLAISSLSRNSRYVGAIWVGIWIISNIAANGLAESLRNDNAEWPYAISYTGNLLRVEAHMLNTEAAWEQIDKLREASQRAAQMAGPMMGPGRLGPSSFPPRNPSPNVRDPRREGNRGPPPREFRRQANRQDLFRMRYPWEWAAGVLAGLFGLSLWTLLFRVKSLDRLR